MLQEKQKDENQPSQDCFIVTADSSDEETSNKKKKKTATTAEKSEYEQIKMNECFIFC